MISVVSSDIKSIGHENDKLEVQFLNGKKYQFLHVPESVFTEFLKSPSKGKFLHAKISGHYPFILLN